VLLIQPESAKLKIILEMVRARPFRPSFDPDDTPYCKRMLSDLARGERIEAIEPRLRMDSEQNPGLERLNRCAALDRAEADDPGFQFFGPDQLSGPPYRYYQIELDGDADNGPEDVLYHEGQFSRMGNGGPGYTWVKVEKCTIGGGAPVAGYGLYGIDVLAKYRDEVITLELMPQAHTDDGKEIVYGLTSLRLKDVEGEIRGCTWKDFRTPYASFDCAKSTSEIEKTICRDEELSRLDIALAKAYRAARVRSGNVAVQDQRKWLRARNACKDTSCIRRAYQDRLEELRGPKYRSTATLAARRSGPSYFATAPHASIDEVFNGCFADAECGRQLEKEMAENTAPGADITNAALRNCLGSQRTMNICVGTWLGALSQELEETLLLATAKVDVKCEALLLGRYETWTRAVSSRCERRAFGQTGGGQATSGLGSSCEIDYYQRAIGALWEAEGCSDCARCLRAFELPNP
jgi:uncharacterized protein YecT (DUF1311 family)